MSSRRDSSATRSWTTVDYHLRRTPAFWSVKRAMAPVSLVLTDENGRVVVYGVNDTDRPVEADLRYGVFTLAGKYPFDRTKRVVLASNASTRLVDFPGRAWADRRASLAFATLANDGRLLARDRLFEPVFKEMAWPAAKVRVRVKDGQAVFTSERYAWGVCLDLDGETALPDNFFDLYPGQPYALPWRRKAPPKVIRLGNL